MLFLFIWLYYGRETYVGKILGSFYVSREPLRIIYIEINGNFIFDLLILSLQTILIELIKFVNRGMGYMLSITTSIMKDYLMQYKVTGVLRKCEYPVLDKGSERKGKIAKI